MKSAHAEGAARALRAAAGRMARARGARRRAPDSVVVVDGARRGRSTARCPRARARRAAGGRRHRRRGRRRARAHRRRDGPVVVLNGDVPLITAEAIAALVDAHAREQAPPPRSSTTILDDPSGYGRVVRDARRQRRARRRDQGRRRRDAPRSSQIKEINAGIYGFDGAALREPSPQRGTDNAQGELYLPDVARDPARATATRSRAHVVDDPALVLGINDRVRPRARRARCAQQRILDAHMRAGVTIVDPATTLHRRRRHDRRRHPHRAGTSCAAPRRSASG